MFAVADQATVVSASAKEVSLYRDVVGVFNMQAIGPVTAEDVVVDEGLVNNRTTDQRVVIRQTDDHAIQGVGDWAIASSVSADEVAVQHVVLGCVENRNTVLTIPGYDVALWRAYGNDGDGALIAGWVVGLLGGAVVIGGAADGVVGASGSNPDAIAIVLNSSGTGTVGADKVGLDGVARATVDFDAIITVTGDEVREVVRGTVRV